MTGKLKDLTVNRDGTQNITVTVNTDFAAAFDSLKGNPVTVEIKKAQKSRSLDANNFCWALCTEIGHAFKPPLSKHEVYRMAIKAVGPYFQTSVNLWDLENVKRRWESNGDGWVFEVVDNDGPGHKLCHLHFGSSTYNVQEMRILIEWLMDQCLQMELPVPLSKEQEKELVERWGIK
jgi:hypothetical protein